MRENFANYIKPQIQSLGAGTRIRRIKKLIVLCFAAGFFCFMLLGESRLEQWSLLNQNALRLIRDSHIEKRAYFWYLCVPWLLIFLAAAMAWWWNKGRIFVLALVGTGSVSMGVCMAVCLLRYHLKGLFLWLLLYFPQILFYGAASGCGLMLCRSTVKTKPEKLLFLWQNLLWAIGALLCCLAGIYCESYLNSSLLQAYLFFF